MGKRTLFKQAGRRGLVADSKGSPAGQRSRIVGRGLVSDQASFRTKAY
jgi:hypothetical protein